MQQRVSVDKMEGERWKNILYLTNRESDLAHEAFQPGIENFETVQNCKILVVGAGGLGCEILKDLALSGFRNIDIIDMDTIDVSNLNRQFLFRQSDIGRSKAEVAAEFTMKRVNGVTVTAHNCKIQDKPASFYQQFPIVICGLDSIQARRWLNQMICDLVEFDGEGNINEATIIPLIDGGTEGFKGNARVILPHMTACVECTLDLYPPQVNFPMCTIANIPRLPEHCIEYIKVVLWDKEAPFSGDALDADNPEHVQWVYQKALERADQFNIGGVTMRLTLGVLKRIIPAVASTNAVIAGVCALEAFKLASNVSRTLDNYVNFQDVTGANFNAVSLERNPECLVCKDKVELVNVATGQTLQEFIKLLEANYKVEQPRIYAGGKVIFTDSDLMPEMKEMSKRNLNKNLHDLDLPNGTNVLVESTNLQKPLVLRLKYTD
ncbi:unnamed protein product [Bursaphelenchus okinawaensis]|uniref:NEDD8-activating enzyme E1 catalytic subunit n=1 Tax=Bursaphelenchus okinawaensis TaxID=465554 RepID=A0A811L276_9BILA|nr:unnamed protein product [Bursaphelenchus okinawaensis]CAG9114881.1 unnamed protein product [Bursaphelenchus okinawaensis]